MDTQKVFHQADRMMGKVITGQDFILIIEEYPHLTFNIKSNSIPILKNGDKVEYTTTHGVKTTQEGQLQTLNDIPISFIERSSLIVNTTLEQILIEDDNGDLTVHILAGKTLETARYWGSLEYSSIIREDNPEADTESGTTPLTIQATLSGHYNPSRLTEATAIIDTLVSLVK
jgi:hypothetical protein